MITEASMYQRAIKAVPSGSTRADRARPGDADPLAAGVMPAPGLLEAPVALRRHDTVVEDALGGMPVDTAVSAALRRRSGAGVPLPDSLAGRMSDHLGMDLSALRVHADPEAGRIARSVQAMAFTHGNDLYFAPGQYRPQDPDGQRVLAHEVSHVAAQRAGLDRPVSPQLTIGRADDPAEAAADRSADRMMAALRRGTVYGQDGQSALAGQQ